MGAKVLKTEVREIAGIPVVEVKETPLDGWGRIIKRFFDIILSLFLIIIFSPIIILTAILIKIDSRGPVIYKNERVSRNGVFKLFKFRSMIYQYCVGDEYGKDEALELEKKLIAERNSKLGPVYKIAADPRLTGVGKFIRRWSIDELPQFFNIFIGNMSLVGPRPHQPREVAKYERHHKKVLTVKPGLTGLAQISGRSDLSFEDEVKLDSFYIENWSLGLDLSIILRTPLAVFKKRKVE
ncbi:MAG: sugar transferase [Patescibacteria group bacterium]|nr:sugar transferase [Patescibacteria group bacterium]